MGGHKQASSINIEDRNVGESDAAVQLTARDRQYTTNCVKEGPIVTAAACALLLKVSGAPLHQLF